MISSDTGAWLAAVSRTFARRVVKEAAMDVRYVPVIPVEDEIIHNEEHPFCDDLSCPCHYDIALLKEQVFDPFFNGLLTAPEASRLMDGKQL